ncbi:hypothetical protein E4T47_04741 [Aureobasidium subglaciale]|nr:hypothetical protein E4T47_04741 [Aureobasidium subglaciale]
MDKDVDFTAYPPAYFGDFGISFIASKFNNKSGGGPTEWYAPEQAIYKQEGLNMYSHTNIWQLGLVMLYAIAADDFHDSTILENKEGRQICFEKAESAGYGLELCDLIDVCLDEDLSERPTPQELVSIIQDYVGVHARNMQRWGTKSWVMRKHTASLQKDDDDTLQRRFTLVAKQMKLGRTSKSLDAQSEDRDFVLEDEYKLIYSEEDEDFDIETFYNAPDPGSIKFSCRCKRTRPVSCPRQEHLRSRQRRSHVG